MYLEDYLFAIIQINLNMLLGIFSINIQSI